MDRNDKTSKNDRNETHNENPNRVKQKNRGRKRKRRGSDSSSENEEAFPDNSMEMEKNVHASAMKNNLDETSVKKILKKVVTNDHVLALVKLREEAEDSSQEDKHSEPKLTRAKLKELKKVSPKAGRWNLEDLELTPIKHIPVKTRPEVKALIAQELPEDEDDEEYEPTNDDVPSDDDQCLESCSDLDSQPRTPATPMSQVSSPRVVKDGPFKVPQEITTPTRRKLNLEEDATIALRTRSKLSLSATSIEHIESTFVPPDDLPLPVVDNLWNQFLNECLNPASTSKHEDDDETDPEYNVAADADAHDEDEEALSNSIIKISKKELNDLVTELFNIMPEPTPEEELMADDLAGGVLTEHSQAQLSHWEGKQEPVSDEEQRHTFSDRIKFEKKAYRRMSIGKSEPPDTPQQEEGVRTRRAARNEVENSNTPRVRTRVMDIAVEERQEGDACVEAPSILRRHLQQPKVECVTIHVENEVPILPEQIMILQQQLRQHIQITTCNYLQLYVHPIHWSSALPFKEYLQTLSKLAQASATSVVNVCNLKPALELVDTWEKTVSANTPENKRMVEFILEQSERCRRRFLNKSLYVGEFHDTFKDIVANSSVFLYPHLLPPMPYRTDPVKRYFFTRSEDELIAFGLDQFWDYVNANPDIYKLPPADNPRTRRGLAYTIQLVIKHMFPWMPYKMLFSHIQLGKKSDPENPIYKFFKNRTVTPVKHTLLPFNPNITLYEQPEHEVPRIWVRHLSKTSKRFRKFLSRRNERTGVAPLGVDITLGEVVAEPTKAPLPIDFTKEIVSNRINLLPKVTKPVLADRFDIQIESNNGNQPTPISLGTTMYKLVETSTGAFLMPLNSTVTVNSQTGPISSPVVVPTEVGNNSPESSRSLITSNLDNKDHCSCCILLRKICKQKQTVITDYFRLNSPRKTCYCKGIKYPKVSTRLKMLVNNYKNNSKNALQSLDTKLRVLREKRKMKVQRETEMENHAFDLDEFVFVTSFHLKLLTRLTVARDTIIKRKVHTILSRFNTDLHDPIELTKRLYVAFGVELVDMYKEFLCFLTPEQADILDAFRDYFVRNCVQDLIKRVETQIPSEKVRLKMLQKLHQLFYKNLMTACEICTDLLSGLEDYPGLAQHVFSLFPHRKENRHVPKVASPAASTQGEAQTQSTQDSIQTEITMCDQSHGTVDYEADHSESDDNEKDDNSSTDDADEQPPLVIKSEFTTSDNELQSEPANNATSENNMQEDSGDSNASMTIVYDEDPIKPEATEWKRDEDKLILEVLKEHLTPEERKDKTIIEIIEEKNIIDMLADSLTHKSKVEINCRVLYLLQLLVLSEK